MDPMDRPTMLQTMTTIGEALAGQQIASLEGAFGWTLEPDQSGGGKLAVTFTGNGGQAQTLEWALTPIGGLPQVPVEAQQGVQLEPPSVNPTNPDTSLTGTATMSTSLDVGLGTPVRLPI